jgi:hypothetical protein
MTIYRSDYKQRDLLTFEELTDKEKAYVEDFKDNNEELFFRYRDNVYALGEVERITLEYWDGCINETYSSGVLVRLQEDENKVIVGNYYTASTNTAFVDCNMKDSRQLNKRRN